MTTRTRCAGWRFSHLWVTFGFHLADGGEWRPTVRLPRLGGNARVGVFATRAPFRPNPLGLSALRIESIHPGRIGVSGLDIADGSPVSTSNPTCRIAMRSRRRNPGSPRRRNPRSPMHPSALPRTPKPLWTPPKRKSRIRGAARSHLRADPRPAYQADGDGRREYGLRLWRWNIRFTPAAGEIYVSSIEAVAAE
ncbi:MAG: TrmO family methyltransferase [Verrucomicrobiales bacterium]